MRHVTSVRRVPFKKVHKRAIILRKVFLPDELEYFRFLLLPLLHPIFHGLYDRVSLIFSSVFRALLGSACKITKVRICFTIKNVQLIRQTSPQKLPSTSAEIVYATSSRLHLPFEPSVIPRIFRCNTWLDT